MGVFWWTQVCCVEWQGGEGLPGVLAALLLTRDPTYLTRTTSCWPWYLASYLRGSYLTYVWGLCPPQAPRRGAAYAPEAPGALPT